MQRARAVKRREEGRRRSTLREREDGVQLEETRDCRAALTILLPCLTSQRRSVGEGRPSPTTMSLVQGAAEVEAVGATTSRRLWRLHE